MGRGTLKASFKLKCDPLVSHASSATVGLFKVHLPPFVSAVIATVYPEARTVVQMHLNELKQKRVCVCVCAQVNVLITSSLSKCMGSEDCFKRQEILIFKCK